MHPGSDDDLIDLGTAFQGRYQVQSKLGSGGNGHVFKAIQRATGKPFALKVIAKRLDEQEPERAKRIARFQRETALCARLSHPNIVPLVDADSTEDGHFFAVFELVPGVPLAALLAQGGALDPREARHLMLQVLDALACAHALGVVHRDLKPHNVMITTTGARRNAIVLDFGIGALVEDARPPDHESLTTGDGFLGTPSYAAPEQLRGGEPTTRSDLYAWGLVFLECLTGRRVMSGPSLEHVLFKQLGDAPIALPPALADHPLGGILRRALARDVDERSATAQEVFAELDACDLTGLSRSVLAAPAEVTTTNDNAATEDDGRRPTRPPSEAPPGNGGSELDPDRTTVSIHGVQAQNGHAPCRGERRSITAVSCALSIAGPAAEDPETMAWFVRLQRAICREVAGRNAGYVAGDLGDRTLVYFGYPSAREDDAALAARAALEIVRAFKDRSADLRERLGVAAACRIGVHAGIALVRDLSADSRAAPEVVGSPSTIAAHLDALAPPGSILVSDATRRLLDDPHAFSWCPVGFHKIPGFDQEIEAFSLSDEDPPAAEQSARRAPLSPFFGRTHELRLLEDRLRAAASGSGRCIVITGEQGIGKSRLVTELCRTVAADAFTALSCRCAQQTEPSPLRPIAQLIARLLGFERGLSAEQKTRALSELCARYDLPAPTTMPLFARLLSIAEGPRARAPSSPEAEQKALTLRAISTLFLEMAAERPLLLIVEDLHWADPTTLELLEHLIDDARAAPLCLLLTGRPDLSLPWKSSKSLEIQLDRLSPDEALGLVSSLEGGAPLPEALRARIVEDTDGVPLFIEEITRAALEERARSEFADRDAPSPSSGTPIPEALRRSLMLRLDRMGDAKQIVKLASIFGREFEEELMSALADLDPDALSSALRRLMSSDLIRRKRHKSGVRYVFKHALVRDVAYESLPTPVRREHHARAAIALEARKKDPAHASPELLAHRAASESGAGSAAGPDDESVSAESDQPAPPPSDPACDTEEQPEVPGPPGEPSEDQ